MASVGIQWPLCQLVGIYSWREKYQLCHISMQIQHFAHFWFAFKIFHSLVAHSSSCYWQAFPARVHIAAPGCTPAPRDWHSCFREWCRPESLDPYRRRRDRRGWRLCAGSDTNYSRACWGQTHWSARNGGVGGAGGCDQLLRQLLGRLLTAVAELRSAGRWVACG